LAEQGARRVSQYAPTLNSISVFPLGELKSLRRVEQFSMHRKKLIGEVFDARRRHDTAALISNGDFGTPVSAGSLSKITQRDPHVTMGLNAACRRQLQSMILVMFIPP
jgi:hypothetical protein